MDVIILSDIVLDVGIAPSHTRDPDDGHYLEMPESCVNGPTWDGISTGLITRKFGDGPQ
jgi:hypothetical protein